MRSSLSALAACSVLGAAVGCADAPLPLESSGHPATSSIVLGTTSVSLAVGDTVRVPARLRTRAGALLDGTSLTWRTADPSVAVVEDGLIIPVGTGRTRVLVEAPDGVYASVTVNSWGGVRVTGLVVDPDTMTVGVGAEVRPGGVLQYSNGAKVHVRSSLAWRSLNTALASVVSGRIRGVAVGETKVVASLVTLADTAALRVEAAETVAPPPPPSSSGPAELPRATVDVTLPAVTGRTIRVPAGGNVQAAIDSARLGDEIVLQAGATYVGRLRLRTKPAGTGWITIRTSGTLPSPGTRVTPKHAPQMARVYSLYAGQGALVTEPGAHHYRIIGLELTGDPAWSSVGEIVSLGDGGGGQDTMAEMPHHLVLDRSYVHGTAKMSVRRCVGLNSATTAIVDSWLSDCHEQGFDSQAIAGWNGAGPYLIENNHLAGAGENVMFGGADPQIDGMLPRDITIRRNHFYKPPAWHGVWMVKNSFELKIGQRVLFEGNVIENNWNDAQTGFVVVLKSTNQDGTAPWSETSDVTMRYNVIRNSTNGLSIAGLPGSNAVRMSRVLIAHNVLEKVGRDSDWPGGRLFQIGGVPNLTVTHNTAIGGSHPVYLYDRYNPSRNFVLTYNILGTDGYAIASAENRGVGVDALNFHTDTSWTAVGNVLVGGAGRYMPANNFLPGTPADVGFVDLVKPDLRLRSTSPYAGKAGYDAATLGQKTAGVVVAP